MRMLRRKRFKSTIGLKKIWSTISGPSFVPSKTSPTILKFSRVSSPTRHPTTKAPPSTNPSPTTKSLCRKCWRLRLRKKIPMLKWSKILRLRLTLLKKLRLTARLSWFIFGRRERGTQSRRKKKLTSWRARSEKLRTIKRRKSKKLVRKTKLSMIA